ncbi:MAG: ferrous iron transport protein B [Burkholderiales bacterium]|jgi:ferrous iron transport protein B|nr:ferrous iron transport protein B [Burkholderiales bacterium]
MKRVALLGMPNTGKSTLFNRLTGAHAKVGNWPGLTVELLSAKLLVGNQMVQIVDLPGIYDLHGFSDDEKVVTAFLETQTTDLLVVVLNTPQIERQLSFVHHIMQLQIPVLLVMNMVDEARKLGMDADAQSLSQQLGVPVCLLSAKYGQGMEQLLPAMQKALLAKEPLPAHTLDNKQIEKIFSQCISSPARASHALTESLDQLLLHPWLGLPIFFTVMLLVFQGVFAIGKPLQDATAWVLTQCRAEFLEPLIVSWPLWLQGLLLDGLYNGLGTVASFIPLIILFFLFMGIVEDTGYLSRAAYLMDALMARFGLDGRSFVMLLMGFGCNVPALMGTRVIRSRGLRYLTMLTIPFSLCSARLQVFVFFIAALFTTTQAPWVLFSLYWMSLLMAMLTSVVFKNHYVNNDAFILEMPPYRFPTTRQIVLRGWQEVRHFLNRATKFIVLGVILVWALTNFPVGAVSGSLDSWAGQMGQFMAPVISPLGIHAELTIALIFGFVAKEIVIGSLAVIYAQEGQQLVNAITHSLNWIQAYSFMLFVLIYTPCLSTIATIRSETKSLWFTALAVAWPLCLAWCVSFVFYQMANYFVGT